MRNHRLGSGDFLIYGSYGYTGDLIARRAVARGHHPILAGRDAVKLATQARELGGLEHVALSLDNTPALEQLLSQVQVVLHCAGPYSTTAQPMVDACLRTGAHYLDITGELRVLERLATRDAEARTAGVMILPAVGFDVVPTDCLAVYLGQRLPAASHLVLGIKALGSVSRGTAATAVEMANEAGKVRHHGELVSITPGSLTRQIDFGQGSGPSRQTTCVALPWADLITAYHSTGIRNIEVYYALPQSLMPVLTATRYLGWLLTRSPVQALLKAAIQFQPPGPTREQREKGLSLLWGQVRDAEGNQVTARLHTPESYALTAQCAVAAVEKVLAGQLAPGFQTPALAFGPDFVLEFEGVVREDLAPERVPS